MIHFKMSSNLKEFSKAVEEYKNYLINSKKIEKSQKLLKKKKSVKKR